MNNKIYKWNLAIKSKQKDIVGKLLEIRGITKAKDKKEFLNPTHPENIPLEDLGLNKKSIDKVIKRIKEAKKNDENVIVYGDYDADGITGTAILWETLYAYGLKVLPYIPDRFSEGYGLNTESIKKLKKDNPNLKLVITVDHGIVSDEKVDMAKELGIDVVITDHHQKGKIIPAAYEIVHTTQLCGSAVSWILSRELRHTLKINPEMGDGLELAGIGTLADQMPLLFANRSFAKYGLIALNKTKRPGLLEMIKESGLTLGEIKTFEINFMIAPRINATGRMAHAMESLQLLCTRKEERALELSKHLGSVNTERQVLLEEIYKDARERLRTSKNKILVISGEEYNEGIIGLAASRLVEEYYRPAIVLSKKEGISKASARSIGGFNIIEAIRKLEGLYKEGGGHPMAAGFSIDTDKIEEFEKRINENSDSLLTEEILTRKINIDLTLEFKDITQELVESLKKFEPVGIGNPSPVFLSHNVKVIDLRLIGKEKNHLKLKLEQNGEDREGIFFRYYGETKDIKPETLFDFVYLVEENTFMGVSSVQLKVRDFKINDGK
jgi:single-stranded-DNA-specific exonuclease